MPDCKYICFGTDRSGGQSQYWKSGQYAGIPELTGVGVLGVARQLLVRRHFSLSALSDLLNGTARTQLPFEHFRGIISAIIPIKSTLLPFLHTYSFIFFS